MNIIKDFRNDLLKRREVEAIMEADSNPGLNASKKAIAEELKASEDVIVVKTVRGKFGSNEFLIEAFVYDSADDLNSTEPKKKAKKEAQ